MILPVSLGAQIDPRGEWRTLDTPHFRVHFRAEHHALGVSAAAEAESAYVALARLTTPPSRRIELVVTDNIDQSNGFATTYPVPRMVIFAQPPAGDLQLGAYDRWQRLVITHELAHLFHLDVARGWWGLGRRLLGRAPFLFPNEYAPPWLREGVAVYYETAITGEGRLRQSFHRAVVTAGAAADANGTTLSEASISSAIWPGGTRAYAHGGTFIGLAAERAGDSAVAAFIRRGSSRLLPYVQLSSAFKQSTGAAIGPMWRSWQRSLRDSLAAAADQGGPRVVISRERHSVAPRLSRDGRQVLMACNDGRDTSRLCLVDVARGTRLMLGRVNAPYAVAWESDTSVIVSQFEYTDGYTLRSDLWRFSVPEPGAWGQRVREERLTRGARILGFDVAPNGEIVAVQVVPGGTQLVVLAAAAPGPQPLAPAVPGTDWADPRWISDTSIVANIVRGGWHDIAVVTRSGRIIQVTSDSTLDLAPWPVDGGIVWSREVNGTQQIVTGGMVLSRDPYGAMAPVSLEDSVGYLAYRSDGFALIRDSAAPGRLVLRHATAPSGASPPQTDTVTRGYSPLPGLLPQYFVPLAYVAEGGNWFGAISSGQDALDKYAWSASLEVGSGLYGGQWRGAFAWNQAGPGTTRLDFALSRNRRAFIGDTVTFALGCCVPDDQARAGITFVGRAWRSSRSLRLGALFDREGGVERGGLTLGGAWSSVYGAPLAISTNDGARLSGSLRLRRRFDRPELNSADLTLRASAYRSFGGSRLFARPVFALRGSIAGLAGNDNVAFAVGGESGSSVPILPGLVSAGITRTHPVRGYPGGFIVGRHVATMSVEHRVPLALVGRNLGLLPLGLHHLAGTVFADAGVAWARGYCPTLTRARCSRGIASVGAELGTLVAVAYDFGVQVRVGAAARLKHADGVGAYAAVGSSF